jgi:hypothetical protein
MSRLTLALTLLLAFCLFTKAQDKTSTTTDASAVQTAVTNYIEGYFTGDADRMKKTLHPHYLKHVIHGDIPMREMTATQMVTAVRRNGPADLSVEQKTEEVTVLDIAGDIASAKLVTPGWQDYMTLSKVNGEWKILSVVQKIE